MAIHVDGLLISGSGEFTEYIACGAKEKFEAAIYEEINRLTWALELGN